MSQSYTKDQLVAVERVMKLKETDYYEILLLQRSCSSGEIKKAYRKQALVMHPDKNSAPRAEEAFRRVNEAFQVLSDENHRKIYDQTGTDPRSRSATGGFPNGGSGFAGANGFPRTNFANRSPFGAGFGGASPYGGAQFVSPEDLFGQFFGAGMGGGPQFQFSFGDNGANDIFSQLFGGGPRARGGNQARNARRSNQGGNSPEEERGWFNNTLTVPILMLLLFVLPNLFDWLVNGGTTAQPQVRFQADRQFTQQRYTPEYHVPFYVRPNDVKDMSDRKLHTLDKHAENKFVSFTSQKCTEEHLAKQQAIQDAQGWFFTDQDALAAAKKIPVPHCEVLNKLGVRPRR